MSYEKLAGWNDTSVVIVVDVSVCGVLCSQCQDCVLCSNLGVDEVLCFSVQCYCCVCFAAFFSVDHEACQCQCLQCSVLMMSLFCLVVMSVSVAFSADVTIRHLLCSVLMSVHVLTQAVLNVDGVCVCCTTVPGFDGVSVCCVAMLSVDDVGSVLMATVCCVAVLSVDDVGSVLMVTVCVVLQCSVLMMLAQC